jgi:hypothetical protein
VANDSDFLDRNRVHHDPAYSGYFHGGEKVKHTSASSIDQHEKCAYQAYRHYVLGESKPPGIALIIGAGVHKPIEADLKNKMATGELLEIEAIADIAADAVREQAEQEIALDEKETELGKARVVDQAVDQAVGLAALHHREVAPAIEPVYVKDKDGNTVPGIEREVRLSTPLDIDILGYIDIQEAGRIRDTKTTGRAVSQDDAEHSTQLTIYHMAARYIDNIPDIGLQLDFLRKLKAPVAVSYKTDRNETDYQNLFQRIAIIQRMHETGIFPPASKAAWWCAPKWCGWWDECPYGRRDKKQF